MMISDAEQSACSLDENRPMTSLHGFFKNAGRVHSDWTLAPLGEVAPMQRGFDLPNARLQPGPYPVVYSNGILEHHHQPMAKGPGVITGRSGTIGRVHFVEEDYWPHNTSLWVTSFCGNDPKFVFYIYTHVNLARMLSGSGVPTLNRNDVHQIMVACPPPAEQRAIAEALSDVEGLLGALEALIAKKQAIKHAAMQQLLTGSARLPGFIGKWESTRIGDVCTFLPTASNPRSDLVETGDVEYIHYGDIHVHARPVLNCTYEALPRIEGIRVGNAARLVDGDFVMVDASEDLVGVGKSIEVQGAAGRNIVAGLHTIVCRGSSDRWAMGFKAYLQFISAFKAALTRVATGSSVYAVSKRQLSSIELSLPPPPEQEAIVSVLSDMDAEITALERRRDKTRAIKQGMMEQLLTGRVRLV